MIWKKTAVWLGGIATLPVAFLLGWLVADPFYMRFVFEGDRKDFAPGDTFGILFWALVFGAIIIILATIGWVRLYRRVSKRASNPA